MSIVNEQLYRLLGHFERGPHNDPGCRLTHEGAALDAYLCSADKPTIAFGCCYHPDGTPVQMGDTITEDQVYPYTEAAVERVVADVKRLVTRPLNDYQTAALCSFVFNLGGGNLASSTRLLPAINAGRWEDAAEAMGEFIRAWGKLRHTDGSMRWHRKAELGLLIRRYAEACLLLGLDWEKWCTTRKIVLHENLLWQPDWVDPKSVRKGGRYFDEVLPTTTQFHVIEEMARATPLPPLVREELVLTIPASPPQAAEVAQRQPDPARSPAAGATIAKPSASGSSEAAPVKPTVPAPQPVPSARPAPASVPAVIPAPVGTKAKSPNTVAPAEVPYRIDPQAGLKPLEETDRAKGYWYQQAGIGVIRLGSLGMFGTTLQGGAQALQGDPVLSNLVLTAVVLGGVTMTGYVVKVYGDWKRKRGEKSATQGMY